MFPDLHPRQRDLQQPNEAMTLIQVILLFNSTMTINEKKK